jgi:hypothetical protein
MYVKVIHFVHFLYTHFEVFKKLKNQQSNPFVFFKKHDMGFNQKQIVPLSAILNSTSRSIVFKFKSTNYVDDELVLLFIGNPTIRFRIIKTENIKFQMIDHGLTDFIEAFPDMLMLHDILSLHSETIFNLL